MQFLIHLIERAEQALNGWDRLLKQPSLALALILSVLLIPLGLAWIVFIHPWPHEWGWLIYEFFFVIGGGIEILRSWPGRTKPWFANPMTQATIWIFLALSQIFNAGLHAWQANNAWLMWISSALFAGVTSLYLLKLRLELTRRRAARQKHQGKPA